MSFLGSMKGGIGEVSAGGAAASSADCPQPFHGRRVFRLDQDLVALQRPLRSGMLGHLGPQSSGRRPSTGERPSPRRNTGPTFDRLTTRHGPCLLFLAARQGGGSN